MSNENLRQQTRTSPAMLSCADVEGQLGPLIEGRLDFNLTVQILDHVHECRACERLLLEFRKFVMEEPPEPKVPEKEPLSPSEPFSPFWAEWQDRLQRWLDVVFPGTVLTPVFRSGAAATGAQWEHAARRQSERPLLLAQAGDLQLTLHVARGLAFGRIAHLNGEPLYPALITLQGEEAPTSTLSQPDGVFELRWDPEASNLECQSPLGAITRFPLSSGD